MRPFSGIDVPELVSVPEQLPTGHRFDVVDGGAEVPLEGSDEVKVLFELGGLLVAYKPAALPTKVFQSACGSV